MSISNSELAAQIQQYWIDLDADRDQFKNWLGGTVTGGENGDGTYPLTDYTGNTVYVRCPARIVYDANRITLAPNLTGPGPHTMGSDQYNKKVLIQAGSAITVNLPANAPVGTSIILRGVGAPIKFVALSGASLRNWQAHNGSGASLALVSVIVEENTNGSSAVWAPGGNT